MKHYDFEEEFHNKDKKSARKERRRLSEKDRSKYKKTDQSKRSRDSCVEETEKGRVISISGEGSIVDCDRKRYLCSLKGFLKKEKSLSKNLIAVGDVVSITVSGEDQGAIVKVHPRTSLLSRIDISGKKEQLIAVNVDLALICASILSPPLKPSLIDRYLIAAEKGNLQPIIIVNKIDLSTDVDKNFLDEFVRVYQSLKIPVICMSSKTGEGIEALKALLLGKTSVFSGQSGVGKSSILNLAFGLSLKTGNISTKTDKGAHTTTRAELLPLPGGGYCVDTPGIRSFGLWDLTKTNILNHFSEFKSTRRKPCKFPNCTHTNEPDCSVLRAVKRGTIPKMRYESYLTLIAEAEQKKKKTTWS